MTVREMARAAAENYNGRLPAYSWPGAYTIIYVTVDFHTICADCANTELIAWRADYEYWEANCPIVASPYWEGPVIQCDGCNADIESSYGDPEENSDNA